MGYRVLYCGCAISTDSSAESQFQIFYDNRIIGEIGYNVSTCVLSCEGNTAKTDVEIRDAIGETVETLPCRGMVMASDIVVELYNQQQQQYQVMSVLIDQNNPSVWSGSNSALDAVCYADDAIGMTPGSAMWDTWFGCKPCLLPNGYSGDKTSDVVRYLDPDDFSKYEDTGNSADIYSGDAGDVMIEFPIMGVRIQNNNHGILIIQMTNNPSSADFSYFAHTKGSDKKDYFYVGSYISTKPGDPYMGTDPSGHPNVYTTEPFRSLSGAMTLAYPYMQGKESARANGDGYELLGFYQFTFIQCMAILKYKKVDLADVVGNGFGFAAINTQSGTTDTSGMCTSYTDDVENQRPKIFGIEDLYGRRQFLDGVFLVRPSYGEYYYSIVMNNQFSDGAAKRYVYTDYPVSASYEWSAMFGTSAAGLLPQKNSLNIRSGFHFPLIDSVNLRCSVGAEYNWISGTVPKTNMAVQFDRAFYAANQLVRIMYI